jgi:hypothetical protein
MKSEPWLQQRGEGDAAYALFRAWLAMGANRSIPKVAAANDRDPAMVKRVSHKWHWISRLRAHESELTKAELNAAKRKLEQDAVKWAHRFGELRDDEFAAGKALLAKAKKMLAFPLTEETMTEAYGPTIRDFETGELVRTKVVTVIVKPVKFGLRDAAIFVETASKLMRLAMGKETERKVLGIDIFGDTDENLRNARQLFNEMRQKYADRPDIIAALPSWLSEQWGVESRLLEPAEEMAAIDGEIIDDGLTSEAEQ